jgi:hypothetical protein
MKKTFSTSMSAQTLSLILTAFFRSASYLTPEQTLSLTNIIFEDEGVLISGDIEEETMQ